MGDGHAICALSGGVDSSVAAVLVHRAIGDRLTCVFVDNGVLRKNEFFKVQGTEVCARVEPSAATAPGQPMRLYANLNHMHLIDPQTDLVL